MLCTLRRQSGLTEVTNASSGVLQVLVAAGTVSIFHLGGYQDALAPLQGENEEAPVRSPAACARQLDESVPRRCANRVLRSCPAR